MQNSNFNALKNGVETYPKTTQFAEFTLTIEDAQEYVYSISPTKRVRGWRDIEVKLYI